MAKKKKKAAKKTVKKKEVKKKKAKKVTWTGTEKTYPAPKPETVETKSDLPALLGRPIIWSPHCQTQPEAKKNCVCCNELVPVSALYLCRSCSFEGCKFCRKSGNCPTCGKPLFQGV